MKKAIIISSVALLILVITFRFTCGIYVVQPIGALPEGTTIIYWRAGVNLPFISSPDGELIRNNIPVSLFSRGMILGATAPLIKRKEIFSIGYSEFLYKQSTGGITFLK